MLITSSSFKLTAKGKMGGEGKNRREAWIRIARLVKQGLQHSQSETGSLNRKEILRHWKNRGWCSGWLGRQRKFACGLNWTRDLEIVLK